MYRIVYAVAIAMWWSTFFYCLQQCETANEKDPTQAIGDNGDSIGPYQIQLPYWQDATAYDSSIGGAYKNCKQFEYSQKVIKAYIRRYAIDKGITDPVKMARVHNAGPKGYKKEVSIEYGNKFKVLWEQYYVTERVTN